jgi:PRTRC genetic system protein B
MKDITAIFDEVYNPIKLFAVLKAPDDAYVEAYDLDENNWPINAHPLSMDELKMLNEILTTSADFSISYLKPLGLLPENVIYLNPENIGFAIWYSPPRKARLRFVEDLGIPEGIAQIPPLVWKADKENLYVFALKSSERPTLSSALYAAPFFNIGLDGLVCMGTVSINTDQVNGLEDFIRLWEKNFFDSYFSHLLLNSSPVNGNIVQLWNQLINSNKRFPLKVLKKTSLTIKSIIR